MKIQTLRNNNKRKSLNIMRKQFRFNDIINRNNSWKHEYFKILEAFIRAMKDEEVYVEAKLIGGGIADVYVSDSDFAVEIRDSESESLTRIKREKYPCEIKVIDV